MDVCDNISLTSGFLRALLRLLKGDLDPHHLPLVGRGALEGGVQQLPLSAVVRYILGVLAEIITPAHTTYNCDSIGNIYYAIFTAQYLLRNIYCAIFTAQYLLCNIYYAIFTTLYLLRNIYYAIFITFIPVIISRRQPNWLIA